MTVFIRPKYGVKYPDPIMHNDFRFSSHSMRSTAQRTDLVAQRRASTTSKHGKPQTRPRYLGILSRPTIQLICYFGLMKKQISWIVGDRDNSNSWIFGNLEIVQTRLRRKEEMFLAFCLEPIIKIWALAFLLIYFGSLHQ